MPADLDSTTRQVSDREFREQAQRMREHLTSGRLNVEELCRLYVDVMAKQIADAIRNGEDPGIAVRRGLTATAYGVAQMLGRDVL